MSGMYENVVPRNQRHPHSKRGWLVAIVVVAVVVLAACVYPVARTLLHQYQYKQFLAALSSQTTQVYAKNNLRAEVDGTSLRITQDNAYTIYNTMVALGAGSVAGQAPEDEPNATLYYGDQAVMQLWDVSTDDTSRVYVSFDGPDRDFSYIIGEKGLEYLMKPLSPDQNPAWE